MSPDGPAISYKLLARATPVLSSDGEPLGTVDRVLENEREHIFDGIVMRTDAGERFVDAPEVARIFERAVVLTITAEQARELPPQGSRTAARMSGSPTVRRAKRAGRSLRERWEQR